MSSKKDLGQYYTTNADLILDGMNINFSKYNIVEPFVGQGDICKWIKKNTQNKIETYDIDPKMEDCIIQDTLKNPPSFKNKLCITNPPYLARNKSQDKAIYDQYDLNDLYKIHIYQLIIGKVRGGILIIPLNFFCSMRNVDKKLRQLFLESYTITRLNSFYYSVFDDTTYTICSFSFVRNKSENVKRIPFYIYNKKGEKPTKHKIQLSLENDWTLGGEIYNIANNYTLYKVIRLVKDRILPDNSIITNVYLEGLDSGTEAGRIKLKYREDYYYGKVSDRVFATMIFQSNNKDALDFIDNERFQKMLVDKFNTFLEDKRKTYHSLFLPTYRNSNRKRIPFSLCFDMLKVFAEDLYRENTFIL